MTDEPRPLAEQKLPDAAVENVRQIVELERAAMHQQTAGERLGVAICNAAGTMRFVALQMIAMGGWVVCNTLAPPAWRFDPYPFGLLTFIVSLEGVLLATFVLIAQNRMSRQSDYRDHLDLQIDLLAEQEMTLMLRMLRRISEHLQIPPDTAQVEQAEKLASDTNVYQLMREIETELPKDGE